MPATKKTPARKKPRTPRNQSAKVLFKGVRQRRAHTGPRKMPKTKSFLEGSKSDGFAIGVSQEHYWLVTVLAMRDESNRMETLRGILEDYFKKRPSLIRSLK